MQPNPDEFSRVEKVLVDARGIDPHEANALLQRSAPRVVVGSSAENSLGDHACLLTLANLTPRIFKVPLHISAPSRVLNASIEVPWPTRTLGEALHSLDAVILADAPNSEEALQLEVGDAGVGAPRIVHQGWCAELVPPDWPIRLTASHGNALAGVVGAGLALSEYFARACGIYAGSLQQPIGLSLWRPDLCIENLDAMGPAIEYLPGELWMMGLGHLGQATLWSWSMLPFANRADVLLYLQDFDRAIPANFGPQCLMVTGDAGSRKTRICSEFLRRRGFDPAIIDRPVDEQTMRNQDEPTVAIAAFDGQGPRWLLDDIGFDATVAMGVGGTSADFDEIEIHTLPLPSTRASSVWSPTRSINSAEQLATTNSYYRSIRERFKCGDIELAGVSVAVPFVGAIAGALAVAELLRLIAGGPQFSFHKLELRGGELGRHRLRQKETNLHFRPVAGFQNSISPL